jgi:hypothetical protein
MYEWSPLGVVAEGDALVVNGLNIWSGRWVPKDVPPVKLAHPASAGQFHNFRLYRVESSGTYFDFAAAELSSNVWGFYIATRSGVESPQ